MSSIRKEIKKVFESLIDLLLNEDFESVSSIIDNLDYDNMEAKVLFAYLSVTNPFKNSPELTESRNLLLSKVEPKLINDIGEERTLNILKGLK